MKLQIQLIAIQALAIIVLTVFLSKSCEHSSTQTEQLKALKHEVTYKTNKLGQQTATAAVLQDQVNDLKSINDSILLRIKQIEKEQKNKLVSATTFTIDTKDKVSGATTILPHDIVRSGDTLYIYPVYTDTIVKPFATYQVTADKDSIHIISDIKNPVNISQHYNSQGPFKPKELVVDVQTLNPNSGVKELASFHIAPKKRKTLIKVLVAVLGGVVAGQLIFK